jgi:hypothetical protein
MLLAGLLFAAFTSTLSKRAPVNVSQLDTQQSPVPPSPRVTLPEAQLTDARSTVAPVNERSSAVTPPPETPPKALRAAGTAPTNRESNTALDVQQPPLPPLSLTTLAEKPQVAEAQVAVPASIVPPVNERSSGVTPRQEEVRTTISTDGMQPTDPESAMERLQEAKRNQPSGPSVLTGEEGVALLARGDDYLRMEDLVSARLFYERVADAGWASAALRLGETFDPVFLSRAQMRGMPGDMDKAIFWYRRARELGSTEAGILLNQLEAN